MDEQLGGFRLFVLGSGKLRVLVDRYMVGYHMLFALRFLFTERGLEFVDES